MKGLMLGSPCIVPITLGPLALILGATVISGVMSGKVGGAHYPPSASAAASGSSNFLEIENSPRIAELRERLQAGDKRALEDFWQGVERTGTPLIEPVKDNSNLVTVTFL